MSTFETPTDLMNNRGLIASPEAFAREKDAASWLYLCGEEFASMEGGMSYEDVQRAVPISANVVSDPPTPLDLDLARKQIEALDGLPRPTHPRDLPDRPSLLRADLSLRRAAGRGVGGRRPRPRGSGRRCMDEVRRAARLGRRRARAALLRGAPDP